MEVSKRKVKRMDTILDFFMFMPLSKLFLNRLSRSTKKLLPKNGGATQYAGL